MTDHRHGLAGRDLEIDLEQDGPLGVVGEAHLFEAHRGRAGQQHLRVRGVVDLLVGLHEREHALDVGQRLADLAVQHAEEVERDVELDQEGIDQHDVADGHRPAGHPARGLPHHRRHRHRDDRRLADVEQRQRGLVADLRVGPFLELLVVAPGFVFLVVEILHRLEVDEAVDRPRIGGGVQLVGMAAQRGAPVGDLDRKHDVEGQRREGDEGEYRVVVVEQDADYQADLDQRRQDAVEGVADQRTDRAGAALDVAGQPAGLALEMEAQRQRMQMAEHLQRRCAAPPAG